MTHVTNAGCFSLSPTGNSYVYCSSRSLYGMALEGKAPKIFTKVTKGGVPVYSVLFCLSITLLSFLQTNNNAAVVLNWFVSLVTASQLINFLVMCVTYIGFYRAWKAQGRTRDPKTDRGRLPFIGWWQPWTAIYGAIGTFWMTFMSGYEVFLPGQWKVTNFLFSYLAVMIFPVLYLVWKLIHRTKLHKPHEVNLDGEIAEILEYEKHYVPEEPKCVIPSPPCEMKFVVLLTRCRTLLLGTSSSRLLTGSSARCFFDAQRWREVSTRRALA